MNIILTAADSAAENPGGGMSLIRMIAIYALLFGGLWFFLFRPQKKEQ